MLNIHTNGNKYLYGNILVSSTSIVLFVEMFKFSKQMFLFEEKINLLKYSKKKFKFNQLFNKHVLKLAPVL